MEQGQENCEVISECVAFTIGCVSLPSHGWIFHGYPTLIFLGFLHECSGRHHLSEFLPLSAQPNTSTPPSQTSSGICLFTHPRPSPADTGSARPSGMSFPRQLVPADRKKVSGNMNTTPGVRPALSGGCGELKLSVGSPARHTLPGTPCPGPHLSPLTSRQRAAASSRCCRLSWLGQPRRLCRGQVTVSVGHTNAEEPQVVCREQPDKQECFSPEREQTGTRTKEAGAAQPPNLPSLQLPQASGARQDPNPHPEQPGGRSSCSFPAVPKHPVPVSVSSFSLS